MLEIGPIFRSLMHSKGRFWLVAGEVALTLAIVANCTMLLVEKRRELNRPTGLDEANILVVRSEAADAAFRDRGYMRNSIEEDLRALRAESGVVAVTRIQQIPLSGGGSSTGRKAKGAEIDTLPAPYFVVGRDAVKALGVQIVAGREFMESDFRDPVEEEADNTVSTPENPDHSNVIVTKALRRQALSRRRRARQADPGPRRQRHRDHRRHHGADALLVADLRDRRGRDALCRQPGERPRRVVHGPR